MAYTDTNTGTPNAPRLLHRVRDAIKRKHYSDRTEETYVHWIKRFIYFSGKRHPTEMGAEDRMQSPKWLMASPLDRMERLSG